MRAMEDFVADIPELAPAGTEQRIRDRVRAWGFELEPAPVVGNDLLVAKAEAPGPTVNGQAATEVIADEFVDEWYLFAASAISDAAVERAIDRIDWKVRNNGLGGVAVPSLDMFAAPPAAPAVFDPFGFLDDPDPYSLSAFRWSFRPLQRPAFTVGRMGRVSGCGCSGCSPHLWAFAEPPPEVWEPVGAWNGY